MKQAHPQAPQTEVGLVLYPGCQPAMFHGMTDLLQTAGQLSVERNGPPLRVSHWSLDAAGRFVRVYDSHPGEARDPGFLVVPGRLSGPMSHEESADHAVWLSARHADGCVLASSCGGAPSCWAKPACWTGARRPRTGPSPSPSACVSPR